MSAFEAFGLRMNTSRRGISYKSGNNRGFMVNVIP